MLRRRCGTAQTTCLYPRARNLQRHKRGAVGAAGPRRTTRKALPRTCKGREPSTGTVSHYHCPGAWTREPPPDLEAPARRERPGPRSRSGQEEGKANKERSVVRDSIYGRIYSALARANYSFRDGDLSSCRLLARSEPSVSLSVSRSVGWSVGHTPSGVSADKTWHTVRFCSGFQGIDMLRPSHICDLFSIPVVA